MELRKGDSATFWVYSPKDVAASLDLRMFGPGRTSVAVNGAEVMRARGSSGRTVSLSGGINKITVTGATGWALLDRLDVRPTPGALQATAYEAEDAKPAGDAKATELSLASGAAAVTGIGGAPGNGNTLTFTVRAPKDGTYAMRVRYSNPEQSEATHYNPDPLARHADIAVNGGEAQRVLFPHTFHENNFWVRTVRVKLKKGENTVRFSSAELPNFDGETYASETWPGVLLRSRYAPLIDKITIAPFSKPRD